MAIYSGGTLVIDATNVQSPRLTGNLPAINGASLTNLSAGKILNYGYATPNTGFASRTSSTFGEMSTSFRAAITPTASNSILWIIATFNVGMNNTSNLGQFKIYDITNSTNVNTSSSGNRQECHGSLRQQDADINDTDTVTLQATVGASNTTARTYGVHHKNENGSRTNYFFGNYSDSTSLGYAKPSILILEMAA